MPCGYCGFLSPVVLVIGLCNAKATFHQNTISAIYFVFLLLYFKEVLLLRLGYCIKVITIPFRQGHDDFVDQLKECKNENS